MLALLDDAAEDEFPEDCGLEGIEYREVAS